LKSLNNNLVKKKGRGIAKGIIVKFIKITSPSIRRIIRYSGLEFIYRKFYPSKINQSLPTGFIWLIGIYVAFFGVASQRYENRIDIIENRANSIFAQLGTGAYKEALSRISAVQDMWCPKKPDILNPISIFSSLFIEDEYPEMVKLLAETIEDWKKELYGVNLQNANLRKANLSEAVLFKADLRGADLRNVNLIEADLFKADLRGADLRGADLREANLSEADLRKANLSEADLMEANLSGTDLRKANLTNAFLEGADLSAAGLIGANLGKADFSKADLSKASLSGAINLTANQLCDANKLDNALIDKKIKKQTERKCPEKLNMRE
jgi:uncharacterized protein YjbI with pentapeptide repeats